MLNFKRSLVIMALVAISLTMKVADAAYLGCQIDRFANNTWVGDPLARAKELYVQVPTPQNRMEMRQVVRNFLNHSNSALPDVTAMAWAWFGQLLTADYAEGWNDAGETELTQAEGAVERARAIHGRDFSLTYYTSGLNLRARGRHDDALNSFKNTIVIDPDCDRGWAQVGNELTNLGRPAEAPPFIQKAMDLNPPSSGKIFYLMGKAYYFSEDYPNSILWLEKSVRARPNIWFNRTYLIASYVTSGDMTKARASLMDFYNVFPGYTVKTIRELQQTNPSEHPILVIGRNRMFNALLAAGMPEQ